MNFFLQQFFLKGRYKCAFAACLHAILIIYPNRTPSLHSVPSLRPKDSEQELEKLPPEWDQSEHEKLALDQSEQEESEYLLD
jgi:hypothetical protein